MKKLRKTWSRFTWSERAAIIHTVARRAVIDGLLWFRTTRALESAGWLVSWAMFLTIGAIVFIQTGRVDRAEDARITEWKTDAATTRAAVDRLEAVVDTWAAIGDVPPLVAEDVRRLDNHLAALTESYNQAIAEYRATLSDIERVLPEGCEDKGEELPAPTPD
jgi:outer membrane murein-binding lipoprotein Lpp